MKFIAPLIALLCVQSAVAQDSCSCSQDLERYVGMVSRNYAGFADKVKPATQAHYTALLDSLRHEASETTDPTSCYALLDTYRWFFRDKHLQLGGTYMPAKGIEVSIPAPVTSAWTASTLTDHFTTHQAELLPWEGIWELQGYEVGIVSDADTHMYNAMIMRSANPVWKEGMVKFAFPERVADRMPVRYWRGDLIGMEVAGRTVQEHLMLDGIGTWRRTFPAPAIAMDERLFELTYGSEVQWRMLNDSTLYIKLGSCQLANKAVLDSLVRTNAALLERTPNWIVDFRANGGGSTDVYQSLLPYLYTKPFKQTGTSHWLSPENTAALKKFCTENAQMMDKSSLRRLRSLVAEGEKHPNTWHIGSGGTTRLGKPKRSPQRVAILADHGTDSSGESFLEEARGISDKSVIFGENTGGYMDYGDLMLHDLGCDGLVAAIPTSRMNRLDQGIAYDLTGITPDVPISAATEDWIQFVQQYWATH